jgi:hypothetical protein
MAQKPLQTPANIKVKAINVKDIERGGNEFKDNYESVLIALSIAHHASQKLWDDMPHITKSNLQKQKTDVNKKLIEATKWVKNAAEESYFHRKELIDILYFHGSHLDDLTKNINESTKRKQDAEQEEELYSLRVEYPLYFLQAYNAVKNTMPSQMYYLFNEMNLMQFRAAIRNICEERKPREEQLHRCFVEKETRAAREKQEVQIKGMCFNNAFAVMENYLNYYKVSYKQQEDKPEDVSFDCYEQLTDKLCLSLRLKKYNNKTKDLVLSIKNVDETKTNEIVLNHMTTDQLLKIMECYITPNVIV